MMNCRDVIYKYAYDEVSHKLQYIRIKINAVTFVSMYPHGTSCFLDYEQVLMSGGDGVEYVSITYSSYGNNIFNVYYIHGSDIEIFINNIRKEYIPNRRMEIINKILDE